MTWLTPQNDGNSTPGHDGPPPVDEDIAAEQQRLRVPTSAPQPTNPYIATLAVIGVIGIIAGAILWGVGLGNASSYSPQSYEHTDNGVVEAALGSALFGLSVTALLLLLTANAVIWAFGRTSRS